MTNERKLGIFAGVFFLLATVCYMAGSAVAQSVLSAPDYLSSAFSQRYWLNLGLMLEFLNSVFVVGIAVAFYPIFRKKSESVAIAYVAFRLVEATVLVVSVVLLQQILHFSQSYAVADAGQKLTLQWAASQSTATSAMAFNFAMLMLGIGSVVMCLLLLRARMIPAILSVLGLVGYLCLVVSAVMGIFGLESSFILFIPGALFELIFPVLLIAKGFKKQE